MKKLLILGSLFLSLNAFGQLPESHKLRMYTDSVTGTLYYPQGLPMYLTFSTGQGGEKLSPKNTLADSSRAIYFTRSGPSSIDVLRGSGRKIPKGSYQLVVDGVAPVITSQFLFAPKYNKDGKWYYGKGLQVSLLGNDEYAGLNKMYVGFQEDQFEPYEKAQVLNEEGNYQLKYYGTDLVNNTSEVSLKSFVVDLTPPVSSPAPKGVVSDKIYHKNAKISLSASDEKSGVREIEYSLDDKKERVFTSSISLYGLLDGVHTLNFAAVDNVENQEEEQVYRFEVDKIPPKIQYQLIGDYVFRGKKMYVKPGFQIILFGIDNRSGLESIFYAVNGSAELKYQEPIRFSEAVKQKQSVVFYGIDKVGNASVKSNEKVEFLFDVNAPEMDLVIDGLSVSRNDTLFVRATSSFKIEAEDKQSGVRTSSYQIDNGKIVNQSEMVIFGDGMQTAKFRVVDFLGNRSDTTVTYFVDNQAPVLNVKYSKPQNKQIEIESNLYDIYPSELEIRLPATDEGAGIDAIYYTVNKGRKLKYDEKISGLPLGKAVELEIFATDLLGNIKRETLMLYLDNQ